MGGPGSHSRGIESQSGTAMVRLRFSSSGFQVGFEHRNQWSAGAEAVLLHLEAEHLSRRWRRQHRVAQGPLRLPVEASRFTRF